MRIGSDLLEHEPGDLTCIVEAGMRLSALQARLAAHGQMLALDPPGDPTVGELVDGNLSGPRRHRYGAPRDLVIGMTVVLRDGTVASSGGKVVKNVAGYDLGKLFCGAGGAFGQVARVAFRLHPRPAAQATLVVPFAEPEEGARLAQAVLRSQLVPSALDILGSVSARSRLGDGPVSARSRPGDGPVSARSRLGDGSVSARSRLGVMFEGSPRAVSSQMDMARALVGGEEDASIWDDVAAAQLAAQGRVSFDRLDAFLRDEPAALVRVSALNAYVARPVAHAPSPLVARIAEQLA